MQDGDADLAAKRAGGDPAARGGRSRDDPLAVDGDHVGQRAGVGDATLGPRDAGVESAELTAPADAGLRHDVARGVVLDVQRHFFDQFGALINTGPTGTNVCDLRIALKEKNK